MKSSSHIHSKDKNILIFGQYKRTYKYDVSGRTSFLASRTDIHRATVNERILATSR